MGSQLRKICACKDFVIGGLEFLQINGYAPCQNGTKHFKNRSLLLFSCSVVSDSFETFSWPVACQPPLSMAFPRVEYWSGLPFPPPGDPPNPGIEPSLLHWETKFFTTEPPGKPDRLNKLNAPQVLPGGGGMALGSEESQCFLEEVASWMD